MEEIRQEAQRLHRLIKNAYDKLGVDSLNNDLNTIVEQSKSKNFWQDNKKASEIMKKQAQLKMRTKPWNQLKQDIEDIIELTKEEDNALTTELQKNLKEIEARFNELKKELQFKDKYDDHNALLSIFAGAGGTDAQDWSEMLLRMYTRYAEKNNLKFQILEISSGEEAGIKSATLLIEGDFVYGKLRSENGVHRLVRLSPFNADNLRQTSFAKVEVLPKIEQTDEVEVDSRDIKIDVFRAGGHGGQSVNTTDSAVRLTHIPSGISVSIQNERSQLQNKETALLILKSKLVKLQSESREEQINKLKGEKQTAEWGNQIRSYVLHPYNMVKDLRTKYETTDTKAVLDGNINGFIDSYLESKLT